MTSQPIENDPNPRDVSDRLRELDELKNTFVALVSHELRTPMNLVSGYLEMGLDNLEDEPGEAREFFEKAEDNISRLRRVVEELTDFARLQRGKPIIKMNPIPIADAFRQTYALLKPEMDEKEMILQVDIPKAIRNMQYDGESLLIIFRNIMSNAAKFSPTGSPLLIKARQESETIIIAFHDTASPIPDGKRDTIFEDFRQLENYLTRRYEGMGLGLAVARRTARLLGGDILLETREDGNTFKIVLPVKPDGEE